MNCDNSPEMIHWQPQTTAMFRLATLRSSMYFFVGSVVFGLRFPHTGLGVWKTKTLQ